LLAARKNGQQGNFLGQEMTKKKAKILFLAARNCQKGNFLQQEMTKRAKGKFLRQELIFLIISCSKKSPFCLFCHFLARVMGINQFLVPRN